jgi:VIT1/CCC1 family predicted Fe2+/Mn2+ transporter
MMMTAGFLSNALVILAPFPFIRRYTARTSHYLVIAVTMLATFFLLTCLGLFGGESPMPLDIAEYQGRVSWGL